MKSDKILSCIAIDLPSFELDLIVYKSIERWLSWFILSIWIKFKNFELWLQDIDSKKLQLNNKMKMITQQLLYKP